MQGKMVNCLEVRVDTRTYLSSASGEKARDSARGAGDGAARRERRRRAEDAGDGLQRILSQFET